MDFTASNPSPVSDVYGAGFLNDQVGFICSRHFLTTGPEILWTRDGGASWDLERELTKRQEESPQATPPVC